MIQLIRNRDYYGLGLFLTILVMLAYQEIISPVIGVFIIIFFFELFYRKKLVFKFCRHNVLFIGLYLIYLIGTLWAEHREVGFKLMEYKMVFFIFPILFFFIKRSISLTDILEALIWASLILSIRFFWAAFSEPELSFYEISRQKVNLHPTYSSIYFTITGAYLFFLYLHGKIKIYFAFPLIFLFITIVILINSFAAVFFLLLCLAFLLCRFLYVKWKGVGLIVGIIFLPFLVYFALIKSGRFDYEIETIKSIYADIKLGKEYFLDKNGAQASGNIERINLWLVSTEIISENPFGVGTGDIDYHLMEKIEKYNLSTLKQNVMNPHNQFLQIGIDIGYLGISYLVFLLISFVWFGVKNRNYFLVFIVCNFLFNSFFESVLQRQEGIIFYTFLFVITVTYHNRFFVQLSDENANKIFR